MIVGTNRMHGCPGACGRAVPNRLFACVNCWARLPRDLQRPIVATAKLNLLVEARVDAISDAMRFYSESTRPTNKGDKENGA